MARSQRKLRPNPSLQGDFFSSTLNLQTQVITQKKDFDSLFAGFHSMKAISYVVSPDILLSFLDDLGYEKIEVIVGENLSELYKKDLEQKGNDIIDRLATLADTGSLRILVPTKTIHTKLYILENENSVRIIQTSANLTATAQKATRQTNYSWYLDLPSGHPLLEKLMEDYEVHLRGCTLFMDDLNNLMKQHNVDERHQIIEAWVKGTLIEDENVDIKGVFRDISESISDMPEIVETVTLLKLPESDSARKKIERLLKPIQPVNIGNNQLRINKESYIRYVNETHRLPVLIISRVNNELLLGLRIPLTSRSSELVDPVVVNNNLELLEEYLNTVHFGQSPDPIIAKTNMFEALLFMFFTPFANEYMKTKRARYGPIDTRGPRFLYIYGPSHNGKSTFLRFALKLITGEHIEPLDGVDFTKTKINNVALTQTVFPLVFDDVEPSRIRGSEEVFKSYWERWWNPEYIVPQIVITSNTARLKDWAKSRVKRIDFDVHFVSSDAAKANLAKLFAEYNPIFEWFSSLYLKRLNTYEEFSDDELQLAREVMKEIYDFAGRPLPIFFPIEPVEKKYDPGRKDWRDLIYELRQATIESQGNRKMIRFSRDIQHWEVTDYQGYLPQTVKHQRRGNTIIIENPKEFDKWLGEKAKGSGLISRIREFL